MPSSIPILRFPLLPLEEILKCMGIAESLQLSKCSKRVARLVPLAGKFYRLRVSPNTTKANYDSKMTQSSLNCDPDDLVRMLETFQCGIQEIETRSDAPTEELSNLINEISKLPIKKFKLNGIGISSADLKIVLEKVDFLKLNISSFDISFTEFQVFPKHIELLHSHRIPFSDLLSFKSCVSIVLYDSHFTNSDLDMLLDHWQSGAFPNLELLRIFGDRMDHDQQLRGFSGWPRKEVDRLNEKSINDGKYYFNGGEEIRRFDGARAVVQLHKNFVMFVYLEEI